MMTALLIALAIPMSSENLVKNADFSQKDATGKGALGYQSTGDAFWSWVGYTDEIVTAGFAFPAKAKASGSVSQMVTGIDQKEGKWIRFTFRGLPEQNFQVSGDQLFMKIDFYEKQGTEYVDSAERLIYREVEKDRKELAVNGNYGKDGAAIWRTYEFEELLPFPEVDSVKVSVGYKNGGGKSNAQICFFLDDFSVVQLQKSSTGLVDPAEGPKARNQTAVPTTEGLVSLGGRWYYQPAKTETLALNAAGRFEGTLRVTQANANRLFYRDDRLINPFAGNMTAWLRKGYLDESGYPVTKDTFVPDNVTLTFDGKAKVAVVRAKNIPNHPTAKFPDTYGTQGYNPSYIQVQKSVFFLPLEPVTNPRAIAMTARDENGALPMGSVGFAVNGVVFYNPFDAGMQDASSIMDRCCGHPSPDYRYHYHKYPICVNTPFVDKGERHSPVIGFAFDGLPVYGPYESNGVMAKDLTTNKLNAFNAHFDEVRGWHYHVTPGKFPYILGGYFGQVDRRNFRR
ncbi:MAG: YHYH protein [Armatimonadetes bacterium]|nr:YHYH protein [Armatimonadota bacterium]